MTMGWTPERDVVLLAGTPAGGGQDRPARALLAILAEQGLVGAPMSLVNIPGRGGGNAWDDLARHPGEAHRLAINSPTILSNRALGVSGLAWDSLTPLCNLYTEHLAFIVRPDSSITDAAALLRRLGTDTAGLPIALATAIGNANHIALAHLTRHAGGEVGALGIAVFDSARDAIAHVLAGHAELGVITAASPVPELTAGTARCLAVSAPARMEGVYAGVPTWREEGVDLVAGPWRGVIGPAGLSPEQSAFWEEALRAATAGEAWREELARRHWSDTFLTGEALRGFLREEDASMTDALRELGLLRESPPG
ncbi:tripartite tricarboxylate transporter substrate-binding protein [Pararoseomonas indoligenes]|uniref:Tripartite tricarboxylate transporter substrate binding protein n=1 Tax=Roseomonas indoligenes TaxID=2820811 RepID=A0A940N7V1_9PROT|nr:tripartite tricarboxylate transporter substrate-binding protein [Pararoseomonas indoligenes]MBP0495682.1 tripartite tricarboxylate transporter substrate binding protein [Pararoseomonas indoligenes]